MKTAALPAQPSGNDLARDMVAGLVVFLASQHARYITGTVIPVDGGLRRYAF